MIVVDSWWNHNLDYHLQIVNHNNSKREGEGERTGGGCESARQSEWERKRLWVRDNLRIPFKFSRMNLFLKVPLYFLNFPCVRACVREKSVNAKFVLFYVFLRFLNDEASKHYYYYMIFCFAWSGWWRWHRKHSFTEYENVFDCCLPNIKFYTM